MKLREPIFWVFTAIVVFGNVTYVNMANDKHRVRTMEMLAIAYVCGYQTSHSADVASALHQPFNPIGISQECDDARARAIGWGFKP